MLPSKLFFVTLTRFSLILYYSTCSARIASVSTLDAIGKLAQSPSRTFAASVRAYTEERCSGSNSIHWRVLQIFICLAGRSQSFVMIGITSYGVEVFGGVTDLWIRGCLLCLSLTRLFTSSLFLFWSRLSLDSWFHAPLSMNHKQDLAYCEQDNALSPTRIELCGESAVGSYLGALLRFASPHSIHQAASLVVAPLPGFALLHMHPHVHLSTQSCPYTESTGLLQIANPGIQSLLQVSGFSQASNMS